MQLNAAKLFSQLVVVLTKTKICSIFLSTNEQLCYTHFSYKSEEGMLSEGKAFGGSWSIEKLECIEGYLLSYLKVFKNQPWADLWYIDAFSGEGIQKLKTGFANAVRSSDETDADEQLAAFTMGSSLRAIEASKRSEEDGMRGFAHLVFIELDEDKLSALRLRIADEHPDYLDRCEFLQGDVNEVLPKRLHSIPWERARGVAFIDPYATQMEWLTVEAFKGTRCDFWMLFPLSAIMRMLPRSHMPGDEWAAKLTRVFGDEGWKAVYNERRQLSLFGDADPYERESGVNGLLEYATQRYEEVFPGVWGPGILRTTQNSPLFALYAIVPNESEQAIKISGRIAKHLLSQIEGTDRPWHEDHHT